MTTMPQTPVNNDQRDWPNCLVCADLNVHYIAHGRFPRDPHEMNVGPRLEKFKNAALQGCDGCRVITWITEDYAKRCLPYVHDPSTEISVDMRSSTYQVPFRPNLIRLHYWRKQSADEESDKDDNWVGSPAFVHNLASFHHDGSKSWQVAELEVFRKEGRCCQHMSSHVNIAQPSILTSLVMRFFMGTVMVIAKALHWAMRGF